MEMFEGGLLAQGASQPGRSVAGRRWAWEVGPLGTGYVPILGRLRFIERVRVDSSGTLSGDCVSKATELSGELVDVERVASDVVGGIESVDLEDCVVRSTTASLSDDLGYCYLKIMRDGKDSDARQLLGKWPSVCDLLRVPLDFVDPVRVRQVHAVRIDGGWHFADSGDVSVSGLLRLAIVHLPVEFPEGSLGRLFSGLPRLKDLGSVEGLVGGLPPDCGELRDLLTKDFGECRCLVHQVPLTKDLLHVSVGCVQKPAGKAGVIAAAYEGKNLMCHAEEAVRMQDKKLLEMVVQVEDPMLLDNKPRPEELARLCTSSLDTDIAAFGNGYCYLTLLHHDSWWRVARLLGPNPLLRSLHRFVLWVGKPTARRYSLIKVGEGLYHVVVDKTSKGLVNGAGRDVCVQISRITDGEPGARVGFDIT